MTLPICELTELPRLLCACPTHANGVSGLTEAEHAYLDGANRVPNAVLPKRLTLAPLPEYTSQPWSEPRDVKVVDSPKLCSVPHCTKPAGDAFCCAPCMDDVEVALGNIPAIMEDLWIRARKQDNFGSSGSKSSGGERPLPYSPRAMEMIRQLQNTLTTAVRMLAEPRDVHLKPMEAVGASQWLLKFKDTIALDPAGPDIVADLVEQTKKAFEIMDAPKDDKTYLGICPKCNSALFAEPQKITHTCERCAEKYDVAACQEALRADILNSLLSVREIVENSQNPKVFGSRLSTKQVEGWVRRGRLVKKGRTAHPFKQDQDMALYRAGDVLSLVQERSAS